MHFPGSLEKWVTRAEPELRRMSAGRLHRPWDSKVEEKGAGLQQGDHKRQREVQKAQGRDQQPSWGSKRSPDWDGLVDTVFKEEVGLEGRKCTVGKI